MVVPVLDHKASGEVIPASTSVALAVFGSAARGDFDAYSDRDLLIVTDDRRDLNALKSRYDSFGWSCSAYSWNRLQHAADQGSLFVQHLKQESKIVSDPRHRLLQVFNNYSTKGSYEREATGAANLLGDLISTVPWCDYGPMWTVDVLSVGFRSLAVAKLADYGIYSFANSDILNGLYKIGILDHADANRLWRLRQYKSIYRKGRIDRQLNWPTIFAFVDLIDRAFGLGLTIQRLQTRDMLEVALASRGSRQWTSDWYVRCRRVESALRMLKPQNQVTDSDFTTKWQGLFKIVTSPNNYAWHFTGGYETIQSDLSRLAEDCVV